MPPPFDPSIPVSGDTAKHDLIRVRLGNWSLDHSDHADRWGFLTGLNPRTDTIPTSSGEIVIPPVIFQAIDRSRGLHGQTIRVISQRASQNRPNGRPLFAGELCVAPSRPQTHISDFRYNVHMALNLDLNPTRYVRHQGYIQNVGQSVADWNFGHPRLATGCASPMARMEMALDGNDNVLGSARMERNANSQAWPIHMRRYWESVTQAFGVVFNHASTLSRTTLTYRPSVNLRYVETYWEFQSSDPIGLVRRLEPRLLALSSEYRVQEFSRACEGNALSLQIKLKAGIFLRVYAKTSARVRFEISHDLTKATETENPPNGHTRPDLAEFTTMVEFCKGRAVFFMNQVFSFLSQYLGTEERRLPVYTFIHRIARAILDPNEAETIIGILVGNGGRITVLANDPLRAGVNQLVDCGILIRTQPYGQTFYVIPDFETAIAQLRGQGRRNNSR